MTLDPGTLGQIMDLLTQILVLLLGALVPLGLARALSLVAGKHQDAQRAAYVATLVKAAQQSIGAHDKRYDYAATALHARYPALSEHNVHALIEAGVADLKIGLGQFSAAVPADAVVAQAPAPAPDPLAQIKSALDALAAQQLTVATASTGGSTGPGTGALDS